MAKFPVVFTVQIDLSDILTPETLKALKYYSPLRLAQFEIRESVGDKPINSLDYCLLAIGDRVIQGIKG